jgi:tousled-like kinase
LRDEKLALTQAYSDLCEKRGLAFITNPQDPEAKPVSLLKKRYQLLELRGRGGFSQVFKAFDLEQAREVACKIHILNTKWSEAQQSQYLKQVEREARIQEQFNHQNIVRMYDHFTEPNNTIITVMEYCEGPDLGVFMKKNHVMPEEESRRMIKQVLDALKCIHDANIIHAALKPSSILIHKLELKVLDFALCKETHTGAADSPTVSLGVGSYWYQPPEAFKPKPEITSKVDIWSLGVLFYELLFGQRPFIDGGTQNLAVSHPKPPSLQFPESPATSTECQEFIKKCLAQDPAERYNVNEAYQAPYMNKTL